MDKGIYTLIIRLKEERRILVGSLGSIVFPGGYYAYTGSARGSGGLKRLERHKRLMQSQNQARRWHIDYLLPSVDFIGSVITHTDKNLECMIAKRIGVELSAISAFGCADCSCCSHLHYSENLDRISSVVLNAHKKLR
ncbi:MAG: GIY-YIG nuclease family protein [Methanotrichaceae archaeon]|nr:GIY-YIG nuclease family protein [Methanotrichaceae archaeon]